MGCAGASELYLAALNALVLLCALAIIGYSAYLLAQFQDLKAAVTTFPILAPLVLGAGLFIVSVVGLVGARKRNKCLLLIYIVFTSVVTIVVFASGAALLAYGGFLDNVKDGQVSGAIESKVQDFELAVYTKCCVNQFQGAVAAQACADNGDSEPCIDDVQLFNDFVNKLPQEACNQLENVDISGSAVVGDPAQGGCGGGDPETFVNQITVFVQDNIKAIGIANLVFAVIMLLDLIASCVLLWSKKELYTVQKSVPTAEPVADAKAGPEIANGDMYLTSQRFSKA